MNSSGRLPSADWSTPVAPGLNRSPSCSTERPTSEASKVTATAEQRNGRTAPVGTNRVTPASTTATARRRG